MIQAIAMVNQAGIATSVQSQEIGAQDNQAPRQEPHFRPRDIGYFDPNSQTAPIEVKDTYNTYHNVFSFINRLRVKASTINATLLRQNIELCLLEAADDWYANQLNHLSRLGLRNDANNVKEWCDALEARFRDSPGKSLTLVKLIRYIIKDARDKRDSADYVLSIILNGKNAKIVIIDAAQVLLTYERIDGKLRRDLPRPTAASTATELLEELRYQKDIRFDIYGSSTHESRSLATSSDRHNARQAKPQGQYSNNSFRQNFNPAFNSQRPYGGNFPSGNGFSGNSGGPSRPYFESSNPYGRPFFPYDNNYQSNNNTTASTTRRSSAIANHQRKRKRKHVS